MARRPRRAGLGLIPLPYAKRTPRDKASDRIDPEEVTPRCIPILLLTRPQGQHDDTLPA